MKRSVKDRIITILMLICLAGLFPALSVSAADRLGQVGHWIGYYTAGAVTMDSRYCSVPATFYVQRDGNRTLYAYQYSGRIEGDGSTASVSTNGKVSTSAQNGRMEIPGTAVLRIRRTTQDRTVTVRYYIHNDTTGSDTPKASRTITVPRLARMEITYYANGGACTGGKGFRTEEDGRISGQDGDLDPVYYGEGWNPASADLLGLRRTGYVFTGWSEAADGSGQRFDPDGSYDLTDRWDGAGDSELSLFAVWEPIEADEAEIIVGKTMETASNEDAFRFRIEAVEGWRNDNENMDQSGQRIPAADVPMPEGTPAGSLQREIEIRGFRGHPGLLIAKSSGLIRYEYPGWYLYRISEILPDSPAEGVRYDDSTYFAVVYVEYAEEEGNKVRVRNMTAWHNSAGSSGNYPDLSDIASKADHGGMAAGSNDRKGRFGKVGCGTNSLEAFRFWNDQETGCLRVRKQVAGPLGDRTREFRFTIRLAGIGGNVSYDARWDGGLPESGFEGEGFRADGTGCAELRFRLKDDESLELDGLPPGTEFEVLEEPGDHRPAFTVSGQSSGRLASGEGSYGSTVLSTDMQTMAGLDTYTVVFVNTREMAPVTGVLSYGVPALSGLILAGGSLVILRRKIQEPEDL